MDFFKGKELRVLHLPVYADRSAGIIRAEENVRLQSRVRLNRPTAEKNKLVRDDAELLLGFSRGRLLRRFSCFDVSTGTANQSSASIMTAGASKNHTIRNNKDANGSRGVRTVGTIFIRLFVRGLVFNFLVAHILRQLGCGRRRSRGIASLFQVGVVFLDANALSIIRKSALLKNMVSLLSSLVRIDLRFIRLFFIRGGAIWRKVLSVLLGEQVVVIVFVQHGFDVEFLAVCQLFANLTGVNSLHSNIHLRSLCPCELNLLLLQIKVRLLYVIQGPQRIELDLDGGDLVNLTRCQTGLKNDRQQVTQIFTQHPLLDPLHVVVIVLHAGVVGRAETPDGLTKKDYLGNIGECGKKVAGCAHHIVDAAKLEGLEVVILAFGVNHQAIQKASGHINDLEPSKDLALPFLCGKFSRQVLHLINGLDGSVQQFWSAAVCGLCITDRFVQSDVLRNTPKLINRVRGVLRQNTVLKNEAPAVMDGKCPVLAEHLIVFRHTEAASSSAERVPWVVIEKGGVVWLDDRAVKNADIVNGLDVFPVHRLIEAAAIIDEGSVPNFV